MEEASNQRAEPRLARSHSLAERILPLETEQTKPNTEYDFLSALRRTEKLTAERIDATYRALKLTNLPTGLYQYALKISQLQKTEGTKMILEIVKALREYIRFVEIPEQNDVYRELDQKVRYFEDLTCKFVEDSEIISNCMRYARRVIAALQPSRVTLSKAKTFIDKMLERWIIEKINDSESFIIKNTVELIQEGETILVYGYSDLLQNLLRGLHNKNKNIHIIYAAEIDNEHSKKFVSGLASEGVQVTFTTLNGVPYFMKKVSKIFMGAITMYSNGSMLGISGSALIAAYGSNFRKPCYVLCETYKFSEKSKIDGMIVNRGVEWVTEVAADSFNKIALSYDLTLSKFISLVISEIGILPPISVSVILREFYSYDDKSIRYSDNL